MDDDEIIAAALAVLQRRQGGPSMTVRELVRIYLPTLAKARTRLLASGRLRPIMAAFGDRDVMSLRVIDAADYRAARKATEIPRGEPGRFYSDLSINFELRTLKTAIRWAVREGRLPHNPISEAKEAKCKKRRQTSPTEDEIGQLLALADTTYRALILLAADSGLRRDEARLMRWDWLDETTATVLLPGWACKNGKDRIVPLTTRTMAALRLLVRHLRSPYVFARANDEGSPMGARELDNKFRDLVRASTIDAAPGDSNVHYHDLRHSYARRAARAGVRIEVISRILGHGSIQQTLDYIQMADDDVIEAGEAFERGMARGRERRREPRSMFSPTPEHISGTKKVP